MKRVSTRLLLFKTLICLSLFFALLAQAQQKLFYVGTFQSDEARTLASMASVEGIPPEAQNIFKKNFYGRLVNEIRHDSFTTYFYDQKPENPEFVKANIEVLSGNTVVLRYFNEERQQQVERQLVFEDGCYTIPVPQWGFKEYFCKVTK